MLHRSTLLRRRPLLPVLGAATLAVLAVAVMGLSLSALAQNEPDLSISKTASKLHVRPNEVVTYTISLENTGTASAVVTLTDPIQFGVDYVEDSVTGGATYSDGQVTWSGTVDPDQIVTITFQVRVAEPGTEGPLPIFNQACADDGTDMVCDWIIIYSTRHEVFLPIVTRNYAPSPP